jgi:serine/threonine protein kinase
MPTALPQSFGRYKVISCIGAGAMGAVYLARDERLGREVAIKAIRDMHLPEAAAALMVARFENEARAVAALHHRNVVQVFDIGVEGETPYLVMEVVPGGSLRDRIKDGRLLDPGEACALGAQMAGALHLAHGQGIVHRDVKPANILGAEPGVWKLTDFGVARVPDSSLTLAGQFLGSPAYAAPEALQQGQTSPAADVYGLGATLYEALVGEPPYGPRGLMTAGVLARNEPPAPLSQSRSDVPPHLESVVMAAVARDPALRPNAADMAQALAMPPAAVMAAPAMVLSPEAHGDVVVSRRRKRLIAWVAAFAGVLLMGILIGSSEDEATGTVPGSAPGASAPSSVPGRSAIQRQGQHRKRWKKALEKRDKGEYHKAAEELQKLLYDYPHDHEARELLDRLSIYADQDWDD